MTPRQLLSLGFFTLCLTGSSCSPKQEPPATKAAEGESKTSAGAELAADDALANYPIVVKLGADGRAMPVAWTGNKNDRASRLAGFHLLRGTPGQMMLGGGSQGSGRIWHVIDRSKATGAGFGGGSKTPDTHHVSPDGSRTQTDSFGNMTTWNKDGSLDLWSRDGSHTHTFPKDHSPGGMIGYRDDPDGSRTDYLNDGTTRRTTKDGDTIEENSPDDPNNPGKEPSPPPAGKPPGDKPSGLGGDPHYITRDGTEFSTQAAGEFVLVTGVKGREVQVRQVPFQNNPESAIGVISALSFRVGESKIEARLDGTVLINGEAAPLLPAVQGDLPGGGAVGAWREGKKLKYVVVLWPDLSVAWISVHEKHLDAIIQWKTPAPEHRGLLGSNDNDAANDLLDREGKPASPTDENSVNAFVESWRVTTEESLFTYARGESTATYTIKGFPKSQPSGDREAAMAECASVPEGFAREKCIFDVMATGDIAFAKSYKEFGERFSTLMNHARLDKQPAKPNKAGAAELQITEEERKAATAIEIGAPIQKTLAAGESTVYKFAFNDPNTKKLGILSNLLEPIKPYSPDAAGYAIFDEAGKAITPMKPATNDLPAMEIEPGNYFLKIFGPGPVDIKLH